METSKLIQSSAILGTFLSSTGRALHLDMYKLGCDVCQFSKEMGATLGFVRQFNTAMQDLKRKMADLAEENVQMRLALTALMNDAEEAEKPLDLKLSALSQEQKNLSKWLNFHTDMFSIRLNSMESQAHKASQSRRYRR